MTMRSRITWLGSLALVALAFAVPASAQTVPTPEGTVITNTATVTYTDANGNAYTPVQASASVTVGYQGGLDVTSAASVTPAAGSTGNTLAFTLANTGNGTDRYSVTTTPGANITITGYRIGATDYADLAALNAALGTTDVAMSTNIVVTVVYNVALAAAGTSTSIQLEASTARVPAITDAATTSIDVPAVTGVTVTTGVPAINRLPGTGYTVTYTVTNTGSAAVTFNFTTGVTGDVSVTGTSDASELIAAGGTHDVTVTYTVATTAATGSTPTVTLTATDAGAPANTANATQTITVVRANVTVTKEVFRDDGTTAINNTTDRVLPGEFIRYRITVSNAGGAEPAQTISVSDALDIQLLYVSNTPDAAGWTIGEAGGTVTATLASLAPGTSRHFWIRAQVR